MAENDDRKSDSKWNWDIQKIPCARESLIFGICSGLLIGAAVFIKTRIVLKACDYAVGSFAVLSFTSWEVCSYGHYKNRQKVQEAIGLLNEYEKKRSEGLLNGDEPTQT